MVYFFAYLFESKFKHKKPSYLIKLVVTTYITVTMLLFWFGIITKAQDSNQYDAYHWVSTVILHLIIPSSMIVILMINIIISILIFPNYFCAGQFTLL
ncbi:hypothetical protein [Spiroplasma mirum]|uniref:hypothetical protein n=1 Tax=Spiroplasma mirum TaxID=2144 RepID=UPI0003DFBDA4|nr:MULTISPECIES: hypothetical protein [Spiroplasma]AHF60772.1 putative transmembrane protein [Spiroplasma mirum ATCC 29335]